MNERTIESARNALYLVHMFLNDYVAMDEQEEAKAAWRKLKNFIDLAEKEIVKA